MKRIEISDSLAEPRNMALFIDACDRVFRMFPNMPHGEFFLKFLGVANERDIDLGAFIAMDEDSLVDDVCVITAIGDPVTGLGGYRKKLNSERRSEA